MVPWQADLATMFPRNPGKRSQIEDMATFNWYYEEPKDWGLVFDEIGAAHCAAASATWRQNLCANARETGLREMLLGCLWDCMQMANLTNLGAKVVSEAMIFGMRWF